LKASFSAAQSRYNRKLRASALKGSHHGGWIVFQQRLPGS